MKKLPSQTSRHRSSSCEGTGFSSFKKFLCKELTERLRSPSVLSEVGISTRKTHEKSTKLGFLDKSAVFQL